MQLRFSSEFEKSSYLDLIFTVKSYNIDSYWYGDQTGNDSDDWKYFSGFVDSKLISASSDDDWIPKLDNCLENQPSRSV